MAADGSIVIDTDLDTSGFKKGSEDLLNAFDTLIDTVNHWGKSIDTTVKTAIPLLQNIAQSVSGVNTQTETAGQTAQSAGQQFQTIFSNTSQMAQIATMAIKMMTDTQQRQINAAANEAVASSKLEKQLQSLANTSQTLTNKSQEGFKNGSALLKYDDQLRALQSRYETLKSAVDQFGNTKLPTTEFSMLQSAIAGADKQMQHLEMMRVKLAPDDSKMEQEIEEYNILTAKVDKLKQELQSVKAPDVYMNITGQIVQAESALQQLKDQGVKGVADKWNTVMEREEMVTEQIDTLKSKMAELENGGGAYTSGRETQQYADMKAILDQVGEQLKNNAAAIDQETISQQRLNVAAAQQKAAGAETEEEKAEALRQVSSETAKLNSVANENAEVQQKQTSATSANAIAAGAAKVAVGTLADTLKTLWGAAQKAGNAIKNLGMKLLTSAANAAQAGFQKATDSIKGFVASLKPAKSPVDELMRKLLSLKTMLISRVKRTFIGAIFKDLQTALQLLAQYDSAFNASMSGITNSFMALSGNLAVAGANLVNAIAPALTTILNMVSTVITAINKLFAFLGGKTTVVVAKKQTADYAASLDTAGNSAKKAAKKQKEYNNQLYSWDELNKVDKTGTSGGGGGGGGGGGLKPGDLFETVPIDPPKWMKDIKNMIDKGQWEKLGFYIAEKLADALDSIPWGKIRKKAREVGVIFGRILNGVFLNVHFANSLGKTLAQGINTVFELLYGTLKTINFTKMGIWWGRFFNSFMKNVDWDLIEKTLAAGTQGVFDTLEGFFSSTKQGFKDFGTGLGKIVNGVLADTDLTALGRAIGDAVEDVSAAIEKFNTTVKWDTIASNIASGINSMTHAMQLDSNGQLTSVWAENGKQVGLLINNLLTTIKNTIAEVDWTGIGTNIGAWFSKALTNINPKSWSGLVANLVNGLFDMIGGFARAVDWTQIAKNIVTGLNNMIKSIDWETAKANLKLAFDKFFSSFKTIATEVDWHGLGVQIGQLLAQIDWVGVLTTAIDIAVKAGSGVLQGLLSSPNGWKLIGAVIATAFVKNSLSIAGNGIKMGLQQTIANAISGSVNGGGVAAAASAAGGKVGGLMQSGVGKNLAGIGLTIGGAIGNLTNFIDMWQNGVTPIKAAISVITAAVAGLGLAIVGVVSFPAGVIAAAIIGGVVALIAFIHEHWDAISKFFSNIGSTLVEVGGNLVHGLWEGIKTAWGAVSTAIANLWSGLIGVAKTVWGAVKDAIVGVWNGIKTAASTVWNGIKAVITGVWTVIKTAATVYWTAVKVIITGVWKGIKTAASTVWNGIKTVITGVWNAIKTAASKIWNGIKTVITTVWNALKSAATTSWNAVKSTITGVWNALKSSASTVWNAIKGIIVRVWNGFKGAAEKTWDGVKTVFSKGVDAIKRIVDIGKDFLKIGENIVRGLWNGIKNTWHIVTDGVAKLVSGVVRTAKRGFDEHSPSKIFYGIGDYVDQGLANGIEENTKKATKVAANLAEAVTNEASDMNPTVDIGANVDDTVGPLDRTLSTLSAIADKFAAISDALTSMNGLQIPAVAQGTMVPYQVRVAADGVGSFDADQGTSQTDTLLSQILTAINGRDTRTTGGDNGRQTIKVNIDGREVFNAVVKENNKSIMRTGVSPLQ